MKKVVILYSLILTFTVLINVLIKKSEQSLYSSMDGNINEKIHKTLQRNISSLSDTSRMKNSIRFDCYILLKKVLEYKKDLYLNQSLIKEKKDEYLALLKNDQFSAAQLGEKVEHYIGYIEAIKTEYKLSDKALQLKNIKKRDLEKLRTIYDSMRQNKDVDFNSSFNLIETSFFHIYGKDLQLDDILHYDEIKGAILKRTLLMNITNHGLSAIFPKIKSDKKFLKTFNKFTNSGYGKTLGNLLFNLPGLFFGFPPLYMAKASPIALQADVFKKLLLEGLNKKNFNYFLNEINKNQKYNLTLGLVSRQRYHLLRKYYLVGATAYTIAYLSYLYHISDKEFTEQNEQLEPIVEAVNRMLKLKENGIDLTKSVDSERSSIECIEYRLCLEQYNPEIRDFGQSKFLKRCAVEHDLPADSNCF